MANVTIVNQSDICIQCVFVSIYAEGCAVNATGPIDSSILLLKEQSTDMSVEGCITDISSGNYTVYVYDMENGVPVTEYPATVLYNIVIDGTDITG